MESVDKFISVFEKELHKALNTHREAMNSLAEYMSSLYMLLLKSTFS
jgi:flagellin-specific chaperone FliS